MFRQPADALNPSAFSIEAAKKWALDRTRVLPTEQFRLTAYFHLDYVVQAVPQERKTRYIARMAQSERNYGLAFGLTPVLADLDPDFVGKDVRQILKGGLCRDGIDRTAFVDLVMGHLAQSAHSKVTLKGTVQDKYFERARIFADEAERLLAKKGVKHLKGDGARVLVVGATAGTIGALLKRGFEVSVTDLSPAIVGMELGG